MSALLSALDLNQRDKMGCRMPALLVPLPLHLDTSLRPIRSVTLHGNKRPSFMSTASEPGRQPLPSPLPLCLDSGVHKCSAVLQGMKGAVDKAVDIASRTKDAYILQQFENPANADVHRETTGPEIWRDTKGQVRVSAAG